MSKQEKPMGKKDVLAEVTRAYFTTTRGKSAAVVYHLALVACPLYGYWALENLEPKTCPVDGTVYTCTVTNQTNILAMVSILWSISIIGVVAYHWSKDND